VASIPHQSQCGGGDFDALDNQLKVERFGKSDIARTIARSLALLPKSRTYRGSILSVSMGSVFKCDKTA